MSRFNRERRQHHKGGEAGRLTTREEHHEFIIDNWDHLATLAWYGFQQAGRGFLNIDVGLVQSDPPLGERFPPFCAYIPASLLREKGVKFPNGDVESLIEKYDPESQIVAFFHWKFGKVEQQHGYRVASVPPPRETVYLGDVGQLKIRV